MTRCACVRVLLCLLAPAGCVVGSIEGGPPRRDTGVHKDAGDDVDPIDEDTGGDDTGEPMFDTGTHGPDTGIVDTGKADTGVLDTAPPDTGPAPTYPTGPYGRGVGQVYQNLCFKGYRDGLAGKSAGKWETICLGDYFDPSGAKGLRAIRLIGAALW